MDEKFNSSLRLPTLLTSRAFFGLRNLLDLSFVSRRYVASKGINEAQMKPQERKP